MSKSKFIAMVVVVVLFCVGCGQEPPKENVAAAAFNEIWVAGKVDAVEQYFSPTYNGYYIGLGEQRGPEAVKRSFEVYHQGLSELTYVVDRTVNAFEQTAIIWRATGVHTGELFGIAPTGNRVEIEGISVYRVEDGVIVEGGQYWHTPEFLNQLKQLPPEVVDLVAYNSQAAQATTGHDLVGLDEALIRANRIYDPAQVAAIEAVGKFIAAHCEPEFVNPEDLVALFAEDFVEHSTFAQFQDGSTFTTGSETIIQVMNAVRNIFPSVLDVKEMFAEGDFVVVQNSLDMTQQLELFGVRPSGERVKFLSHRVEVIRVVDGKITEHWGADDLGAFYHLGVAHQN